jgi:ribose-phosphate pyrophosphokinase
MKIFSGTSNLPLTKKIAKSLNKNLGKIELTEFPNGEARVWVKEHVQNESCVVVQSFSKPPDKHIIEFCLICDALKRSGASRIIGLIPWFGYCVQDKVFRKGEPLNSKVIAKIIQVSKLDKLITLDLHNETVLGFFDVPAIQLSATAIFVNNLKEKNYDLIVSPDVGAVKSTTKLANQLDLPIAVINKKRSVKTGKVKIVGINQQVKGKRVLINDDFISTGQTLIKTADFLKGKGVKHVSAALTHHFYVPGVQSKLNKSSLDKIYITDSIKKPVEIKSNKLITFTAADLLADQLHNC